jgi:PPP family 3-phenylpropionic acid transporter
MNLSAVLSRRLQVDWRILAFYVFAFAAGGVVQPFLNLYLVEIGLSASRIGVIYGWAALAAVIITPLIGLLADRSQRHRLILGVDTLIKGASAPLMLLSSAWSWLVFTVSLRVLAAGVSDGLLTPLTMKRLNENHSQKIGGVRVWGSLSFALTSLLTGWAARGRSAATLFPLAGALGAAACLFVVAFPDRIAERSSGRLIDANDIRPSSNILLLYLLAFLYAFSASGPESFTNVFLVQSLGAGNDLIGLIGAVLWLAPLAGFYFSDHLINRIGGAACMATSFGLFAFAYLGFALIPTPILALPFVITQGVGQALYLVSLIILMTHFGPANNASTNLLLAQMTVPGLAKIVAQPLSGRIFEVFGGPTLFVLDALIILIAMSLLLIARRRSRRLAA